MKITRTVFCIALAAGTAAYAAPFPGPDQRPPLPPNVLQADSIGAENRTVVVTALTDNIFRVDNYTPATAPRKSATTVIREGGYTGSLTDTPASATLVSPAGTVATLDKKTGAVTFSSGRGKGLYDSGQRTTDERGRRTFTLQPIGSGDNFYGAGERGFRLNLAGDTLVMYNRQNYGYTGNDPRIRQMNITMPLLIAPEGYGVLLDDFAAAELVTGKPLEYAT